MCSYEYVIIAFISYTQTVNLLATKFYIDFYILKKLLRSCLDEACNRSLFAEVSNQVLISVSSAVNTSTIRDHWARRSISVFTVFNKSNGRSHG